MKNWGINRPSPSLVISVLALFVALGGTGYAAFALPKNSVGTKQLKNGAVTAKKLRNGAVTTAKLKNGAITTAKLKNGAVTGPKLNLQGVVAPNAVHAANADLATNATNATNAQNATNATNATTAQTANSLPGLTWTPLPLQSGWTADSVTTPGNNYPPPGVTKDHEGFVHLRGFVDRTTGTAGIATLPAGFVPAHRILLHPAVIDTTGNIALIAVQINTDGTISTYEGSTGTNPSSVSLDGITFYPGS